MFWSVTHTSVLSFRHSATHKGSSYSAGCVASPPLPKTLNNYSKKDWILSTYSKTASHRRTWATLYPLEADSTVAGTPFSVISLHLEKSACNIIVVSNQFLSSLKFVPPQTVRVWLCILTKHDIYLAIGIWLSQSSKLSKNISSVQIQDLLPQRISTL